MKSQGGRAFAIFKNLGLGALALVLLRKDFLEGSASSCDLFGPVGAGRKG